MSKLIARFVIETLISSKTRIKLLLKFFLNSETRAHLRSLAEEYNESTNAIRLELNKLEEAKLLLSEMKGNKKVFGANVKHPLFLDLSSIIMKYVGIDKIIASIVENLGEVQKVYLTGAFALGINSDLIEMIIVGDIDKKYLIALIKKGEKLVKKKLKIVVFSQDEYVASDFSDKTKFLLCWDN